MNSSRYFNASRIKYKWSDGDGRMLSAGGILPYDEHGIWVIEESRNEGPLEWNDIGGKYEPEDGDIFTTIAREFCEELYNSTDGCLTRNILKRLVKSGVCKTSYVNGYRKQPVYVAYCIHVSILRALNIKLNPTKFQKRRNKILKQNPHVPEVYYGAITLRYIPFDDLPSESNHMSYRLRKVMEPIVPAKYIDYISFPKEKQKKNDANLPNMKHLHLREEQKANPEIPISIASSSEETNHEDPKLCKRRTRYFYPRDRYPYDNNRKPKFTPTILKRGVLPNNPDA